MRSSTEHDTSVLNRLIEVALDSALGYAEAANDAHRPEFRDLFDHRARERRSLVSRLQEQVRELGGQPADEGTLSASVHRVFLDLRAALSKGDKAVVNEVERGEDHIKGKFENMLKDDDLSPATRQTILEAYQLILEGHDQMRDIKHAMK